MDITEPQCLYLYDTLTLIGTSSEINFFLWDAIAFPYWPGKGYMPAVINIVGPRQAKMVIITEDKLSFYVCQYYWTGLSLSAVEKERIIFISVDEINTLAAIID